MIIGIAGPYNAATAEQRQQNADRLNAAAARVLEKGGHTPLIGINAALPVVAQAQVADTYAALMQISMAVIDTCEALLIIAESPGANRERDHILGKGLAVYTHIDEIPNA